MNDKRFFSVIEGTSTILAFRRSAATQENSFPLYYTFFIFPDSDLREGGLHHFLHASLPFPSQNQSMGASEALTLYKNDYLMMIFI